MTAPMTCERFADTVSELLERDADESTRAAMEWHALECGDCRALLADLRKLRIEAANLPELTPSRDLWPGVAARIDAPVIPLPSARRLSQEAPAANRWLRWSRNAAAAAVLVAATAGTTYLLTVRTNQRESGRVAATRFPSPSAVPAQTDSVAPAAGQVAAVSDSINPSASTANTSPSPSAPRGAQPGARFANTRPSAEQVYGSEIARLRVLVDRRRSQLDPVTVSVIERNLKVIDDAIAQCRAALAKDPASRFLIESLNKALETKVELLRTAAMLPSRT